MKKRKLEIMIGILQLILVSIYCTLFTLLVLLFTGLTKAFAVAMGGNGDNVVIAPTIYIIYAIAIILFVFAILLLIKSFKYKQIILILNLILITTIIILILVFNFSQAYFALVPLIIGIPNVIAIFKKEKYPLNNKRIVDNTDIIIQDVATNKTNENNQ